MKYCIAFCVGVIAHQFQLQLQSPSVLLCVVVGLLVVSLSVYAKRVVRQGVWLVAVGILGLAYANSVAEQRLAKQLNPSFEKHPLTVSATVTSLVIDKGRFRQWRMRVDQAQQISHLPPGMQVIVNSYDKAVQPKPCEQWLVTMKLKRPHGTLNPGGFDYQGYLLQQNIHAKGYITEAALIRSAQGFCIHGLRAKWRDTVMEHLPTQQAAWVLALSIGDKSLLSSQQKQTMQRTGTNHLFVISGLHIALVAMLGFGGMLLLRRAGGGLLFNGDWRPVATVIALVMAVLYAMLAGWSIPTQRAVMMLCVFMAPLLVGVNVDIWWRYWMAMTAVLIIDPLAAINQGFVLSFAAVMVILLSLHLTHTPRANYKSTVWRSLWLFCVVQWALFVGLLPWLLGAFGQASLLAPLVNFLAVPLVSFIALPVTLLLAGVHLATGVVWHEAFDVIQWFFVTFESSLDALLITYDRFFDNWRWPALNTLQTFVLVLVSVFIVLPSVLHSRVLACGLLAAFLLASYLPQDSSKRVVHVLDVDQGLSVIVQVGEKTLVYDLGAAWAGGSMAEFAVLPSLQALGVRYIDRLVISHQDNDHMGDINYVLDNITVDTLMTPAPLPITLYKPVIESRCRAGQSWQWQDVRFTVWHPAEPLAKKTNNQSCVLHIAFGDYALLLPGDIDAKTERMLLKQGLIKHADMLIAPHHGSKTSSSSAFIDAVNPRWVVFTSGYLSRFKHPAKPVVERYLEKNITTYNTALTGAIRWNVGEKPETLEVSRGPKARYWQRVTREHNWVISE